MKLLVTGDKHLGLVSDGVPRLEEQRRVLEAIVSIAREEEPDVCVDLGDLFHAPRPSPDAYALAFEYLRQLENLPLHSYLIAGNHDLPSRGPVNAFLPLKEVFPDNSNLEVITTPVALPEDGGKFYLLFLPFVTEAGARFAGAESAQEYVDGRVEELLDYIPGSARVLAFAHLEVPGAKRNPDDVTQRDVGTRIPDALLRDPRVVRVWAGHIHHHQELDRVTVVGSSIHVDFGEARSPKGVVLAEV